jgi:hypothetical protein
MVDLIPNAWRPIFVVGAAAVLAMATFYLWRAWVTYTGAMKRRPIDMSALGYRPPAKLEPLIAELTAAGFQRLGETAVPIPGVGTGPHAWIFVDESATTQAEVIVFGPFLGLVSYFSDQAVVTTTFPRGERIDRPDFLWITARTGATEAVAAHREGVARFRQTHGQPVRVDSMAGYLRWDAIDRELYTPLRLRSPFMRTAIANALTAALCTAAIVAIVRG